MPSSEETSPTTTRPASSTWRRLSLDVTTTLAVVGLVVFALLRVAHVRFYTPLGLSPDDLGLGYLELLTQAAIGTVFLVAVFGLVPLTLGSAGVRLFAEGLAPIVGPRWRRRLEYIAQPRQARLTVLVVAAIVGVGVTGSFLTSAADLDAQGVKGGYPPREAVVGIPLMSWRAEAANVAWIGDAIDPQLRPLAGTCVMYLGEADGKLLVYSPFSPGPATYRIPAATAAVRVVPAARCVEGVREPKPRRR